MSKPRNFGPPGSILSASQRVARPRPPLKFAAQAGPAPEPGISSWPVVGLPRRGLGNLRRGRKSWFPNRHTAARSATTSSSADRAAPAASPAGAPREPTGARFRPDLDGETKFTPALRLGCGPQTPRFWKNRRACGSRHMKSVESQTPSRLRRNSVCPRYPVS